MSEGLYCVCDGGLIIDTSTITGVLRAAVTLSTANSGSLSYPDLAGRTIFVTSARSLIGIGSAYSNRHLSFSISYALGYPVVNYTPIGSDADLLLYVFVLVR